MATTCASAQSIDSTVNRYWCVPGRNSRKTAESTGRLPPTPNDQSAANTPTAAKLGELDAIRPNTEVTAQRPSVSCRHGPRRAGVHTAQRQIERPSTPEDVAAEAPEHGAGQQANVLREREERRARHVELVGDGRHWPAVSIAPLRPPPADSRISDVTMGHRLSLAQPKPTTTNSCHWYQPMPMSWICPRQQRRAGLLGSAYSSVQHARLGLVHRVDGALGQRGGIVNAHGDGLADLDFGADGAVGLFLFVHIDGGKLEGPEEVVGDVEKRLGDAEESAGNAGRDAGGGNGVSMIIYLQLSACL